MIIGVDIGGTKIAAGVIDAGSQVIERMQRSTPAQQGADAVLATVVEMVTTLRAAHSEIAAVGVGSAGQVDSASGMVVDANENLPGFRGLALRDTLASALHLPVAVENDVKAAALAEAARGDGQGARQMLLVMVGTGIGGALVIDGQIYRGASSIAGEIGHIPLMLSEGRLCACGRSGCIEAYASGRAISDIYMQLSQSAQRLDVGTIAARARSGEELARSVLSQAGYALGFTLGGLLNTLNPDTLVLGGGVLQAGELFLDPLRNGLHTQALPAMLAACQLRRMELAHDAVLIGAALLAQTMLREKDGV
jgi:glucokinase